jgi:hypothetical protein
MTVPTQDDLLRAMEKEPRVTDFGIGIHMPHRKTREEYAAEFEEEREKLKGKLEQFQLCCEWLSQCQPIKTINKKIGGSYSLKHRVERYFNRYVTNGAFIAAVVHLGIPYKTYSDSPNISVALSSRSLPPDKQD